jgi:hypothetical protein
MVVRYRQQVIYSCLNPSVPCIIIASGAVAVLAGIISFLHMAAGIADCPVGSKLTTSAVLDVVHNLVLPGMQSVFRSESVPVFSEDIANTGA